MAYPSQLSPDFLNIFVRHLKLLHFIGINIFDNSESNYIKKYMRLILFCCGFMMPVLSGMFLYIFLSHKTGASFLNVVDAIPSTFMVAQDVGKLYVVFWKGQVIREAILEIAALWPTETHITNRTKIFKCWLQRLWIVDNLFFAFAIISVSMFALTPLLVTMYNIYNEVESPLLYPLQIYYFTGITSYFHYTLTYAYIFIAVIIIHLCVYVSCDCLLVILTTQVSTLLSLLIFDLKDTIELCIGKCNNELNHIDQIKTIVKTHQQLLKLSHKLNKIFGVAIFMEISFSSVVICCFGFLTIVSPGLLLRNFLAASGIMCAIFNLCWPGQTLSDVSTDVANAVYQSSWYDTNPKVKNIIAIILVRSQKPCKLTALGFSDLTLIMFSKVMSTSWSYLSLLNQMYNEVKL